MTARPMEEERVSDIDLDALIITWERNPNLLGFRDAVLSCLRELKANRHLSAEVKGLREALGSCLATIEDYLNYKHDGDPWTEDARAMGEMDINDFARDGRLDRARAALSPIPTQVDGVLRADGAPPKGKTEKGEA